MANVLVTRGSWVDVIWERLHAAGAKVEIFAPGDDLRAAYGRASHVLLPGGADIDPEMYGARVTWARSPDRWRDRVELLLARWALQDAKPLMGICRGHQMITVATGGTLYQDIHRDMGVAHAGQLHAVRIAPQSRLAEVAGCWRAYVNSFHHQAVATVPDGWQVVAESREGVVEAIEHPNLPVISVQWHPERLRDAAATGLFTAFLAGVSR